MKITLEKNGSLTVAFNGMLGFRQAMGLPKLIKLFPESTRMQLDFTDVRWESPAAAAAVIPAVASVHRVTVSVSGLDEVRAPRHLHLVQRAA